MMREEERLIRAAANEMKFDAGFRDRVMDRIERIELPDSVRADERGLERSADSLYSSLRHTFPRLAAAGIVGLIGLGLYSLNSGAGLGGSPLDLLLGIPPETIEAVFALGGV